MTQAEAAKALNEWMRRYIEEPERFEAEFKTVEKFKADEADGKEPSYGETSAAYMQQLLGELNGATPVAA